MFQIPDVVSNIALQARADNSLKCTHLPSKEIFQKEIFFCCKFMDEKQDIYACHLLLGRP